MRIISGKFRGKKLDSPIGDKVRPTTDMVKENIFNIIQSHVPDSSFLDLFAGTGAIGIEALSRGAVRVVFCDKDKDSISLIKSNLAALNESAEVMKGDYTECITKLKGDKFDIIYLDPPYNVIDFEVILENIRKADLLNPNGLVICESNKLTAPIKFSPYYKRTNSRFYGTVTIEIFKRNVRGLVMGSFDPVSIGHIEIIKQAREMVDELVVCVMDNPDKNSMLDPAARVKLIKIALSDMGEGYLVDYYQGLCYEYCLKNSIDVIARGYRDENDYKYETEMAKFNEEHSGIRTVLIKSSDEYKHISSTVIKARINANQDLDGYIPSSIIKYLE